jgi:3-oxoacyl-[acyl-carrier-protein] synthase III
MHNWKKMFQNPLVIYDISVRLPKGRLTNENLDLEHPSWNVESTEKKFGVRSRPIAAEGETAFDLALAACKSLFKKHSGIREEIDAIIFCTQTPDYLMPSNSCLLHKELDLAEKVLAFDFNLACSGYIYGLAIAQGLFEMGMIRNALLINADTYSKLIHSGDRATRLLFGDGASVTLLKTCEQGEKGLIGVNCLTFGKGYHNFIVPAGGFRLPKSSVTNKKKIDKNGNLTTDEHIFMNGAGILGFVNTMVPQAVNDLLNKCQMTIQDIDLVFFHQGSKVAINTLGRKLKIPKEKIYSNLERCGNLVSASIPVAIQEAKQEGVLKSGDCILLVGFGVGLSYGSAILNF